MNDIISKIRKLLALASGKGATEAEAALATLRAQELLERHNLSMADLTLTGSAPTEPLGTVRASVNCGARVPTWVGWLATGVADTSYTFVLLGGRGQLAWIGTEANVRASIALLDFLVEQARRLRQEFPASDRVSGEDFLRGLASRVARRLRDEFKLRMRARADHGQTTALVVLDQARQRVDRYVKENVRVGNRRRDYRGTRSSDAYNAGRSAGDRVQLANRDRVGRPERRAIA